MMKMKMMIALIALIVAILATLNLYLWLDKLELEAEKFKLEMTAQTHEVAEGERLSAFFALRSYLKDRYPEAKVPDIHNSEETAVAPLGYHFLKDDRKFRVVSYLDYGNSRKPFDAVVSTEDGNLFKFVSLTVNGRVIVKDSQAQPCQE